MNDSTDLKSPLKSKKFIAFLVAYLSLMILGVTILAWAWNLNEVSTRVFFLLLSIIIVAGFLAVGYIIGQAGLDKYVRLAQIAARGASNGHMNGTAGKVISKATKGLIDVHPSPSPSKPLVDSDEGEPAEEESEAKE